MKSKQLLDHLHQHPQSLEAAFSEIAHLNPFYASCHQVLSNPFIPESELNKFDQLAHKELPEKLFTYLYCRVSGQLNHSDPVKKLPFTLIKLALSKIPSFKHPFISYHKGLLNSFYLHGLNEFEKSCLIHFDLFQFVDKNSFRYANCLFNQSLVSEVIARPSLVNQKILNKEKEKDVVSKIAFLIANEHLLTSFELNQELKNIAKVVLKRKNELLVHIQTLMFHVKRRMIYDPFIEVPPTLEKDDFLNDRPLILKNLQLIASKNSGQLSQFIQSQEIADHEDSNYRLSGSLISLKRIESASHLLQRRKQHFGVSHVDFFMQARLLNQKGFDKAALENFLVFADFSRRYHNLGEIQYYLTLSPELPPKIMTYWFSEHQRTFDIKKPKSFKKQPTQKKDRIIEKNNAPSDKTLIKVAKSNATLLITGETGVGKEVLSRGIHEMSRKSEPFVAINCGSLSSTLLESELFGHTAGAFTGANKKRIGLIESAGHGTVFLDEIGDMPFDMQVKLLRVLENKEFRAVGASQSKQAYCRFICATHKNLEEAIKEKTFREDLFYRISQLSHHILSLKERPTEIISLALSFLNENRTINSQVTISPQLEELLLNYAWPGNIRELKNEMEAVRILHSDKFHYDVMDLRTVFLNRLQRKNASPLKTTPVKNPTRHLRAEERRDIIVDLAKELGQLRRIDIVEHIGISGVAASKDLKILMDEKRLQKIKPNNSPRTHYFVVA